MSKDLATHHHNAAEHLEQALFNHKEAQKFYESGNVERAVHHAYLAQAHVQYATVYSTEAAKAYMSYQVGKRRAAAAAS